MLNLVYGLWPYDSGLCGDEWVSTEYSSYSNQIDSKTIDYWSASGSGWRGGGRAPYWRRARRRGRSPGAWRCARAPCPAGPKTLPDAVIPVPTKMPTTSICIHIQIYTVHAQGDHEARSRRDMTPTRCSTDDKWSGGYAVYSNVLYIYSFILYAVVFMTIAAGIESGSRVFNWLRMQELWWPAQGTRFNLYQVRVHGLLCNSSRENHNLKCKFICLVVKNVND